MNAQDDNRWEKGRLHDSKSKLHAIIMFSAATAVMLIVVIFGDTISGFLASQSQEAVEAHFENTQLPTDEFDLEPSEVMPSAPGPEPVLPDGEVEPENDLPGEPHDL